MEDKNFDLEEWGAGNDDLDEMYISGDVSAAPLVTHEPLVANEMAPALEESPIYDGTFTPADTIDDDDAVSVVAAADAAPIVRRSFRETVKAFVKTVTDPQSPYFLQYIAATLVVAFLAISAVFTKFNEISYKSLEYVTEFKTNTFILLVAALALVLIVMQASVASPKKVLPIATVLSVTFFCYSLQDGGGRNVWLAVGIAVMCFLFCVWLFNTFDSPFSEFNIGYGFVKIAITVMFLIFTVYLSWMGVCRFRSFTYDTFDFGIFAQMFDYMKETGAPLTTVERGKLLSHFAVHFSPFFYILLPGYYVFSTPEYLCVMQTLFVGLGVFAVYGIAKELGFGPKVTLLLSAMYLTYPALSFGLFYDFHENKFLTVCILFTVYFMLKRKYIPFYACALLLCSVKEDAAIYLVAIALFMLINQKQYKHGAITLGVALVYFVFALKMVAVFSGDEGLQFGYRYSDFDMGEGAGVADIIKVTIMDLGYSLSLMFQKEKMEFLLWMFLPVLFMPLMTKKVSTLFFLAPMLLVNLLSSWESQYDVDYQYTYGTAALIIVCAIFALKDLSPRRRNALVTAAVMVCVSVMVPRTIARAQGYIEGYYNNKEMFDTSIDFIHQTLDKSSAIGAEGNVIPVMYDYPNMVLDPRDPEVIARIEFYVSKKEDGDIEQTVCHGLQHYADNGYIVIYHNPNYVPVAAE